MRTLLLFQDKTKTAIWRQIYINFPGLRGLALLTFLSGMLFTFNVNAEVTCYNYYMDSKPAPKDIVVPVAGNITVGSEMSSSQILYSHTYLPTANDFIGYNCIRSNNEGITFNWLVEKRVISSTSSPVAFGQYKNVYPTNVPGIGVVITGESIGATFTSDDNNFPSRHMETVMRECPANSTGACSRGRKNKTIGVVLIKTGNIPAGSHVVLASSFPKVAVASGTLQYPPLDEFVRVSFSGQINLVSNTCTVNDVDVDLEEHDASYFLSNNETKWKDFNIELTNCPAFHGYSTDSTWMEDGTRTSPNITANSIEYQLNPTTPIYSDSDNIIELEASGNSASGIGIQIEDAMDPSASLFNRLIPAKLALTTTDRGNYKIPLRARYYRTTGTLSGGEANASVEFVINYK